MVDFLLYLYAETPVHAGADSGEGVIDNPIQRETSTRYPVIWGQSLKGALRERAVAHLGVNGAAELFGTAVNDTADKARGNVSVGDAQIVAFPVATIVHTFAWATSQLALARLQRKRSLAGLGTKTVPGPITSALGPHVARWSSSKRGEVFGESVVPVSVEEEGGPLGDWAKLLGSEALPAEDAFKPFRVKLQRDLVMLDDTVFASAVVRGTEVTPRIALESGTKIAKDHHLFFVEYLPAESLLAATITARDERCANRFAELLAPDAPPLQLGGDETIGKSLLWAKLVRKAGAS